jgi:hypothetical protein
LLLVLVVRVFLAFLILVKVLMETHHPSAPFRLWAVVVVAVEQGAMLLVLLVVLGAVVDSAHRAILAVLVRPIKVLRAEMEQP